jgi:hypothetical protein
MTRRRVREDIVGAAIGYVSGLLVLLAWPHRQTVNQDLLFLVAMAVLVTAMVAIDGLVFKRRPLLDWSRTRPARHSIPNFLGLLAAGIVVAGLRNSEHPDRGLIAYSVTALLILAGVMASNLRWARALESQSRNTPAR